MVANERNSKNPIAYLEKPTPVPSGGSPGRSPLKGTSVAFCILSLRKVGVNSILLPLASKSIALSLSSISNTTKSMWILFRESPRVASSKYKTLTSDLSHLTPLADSSTNREKRANPMSIINCRDVPIPKFEPIPVPIPILNFKAKPIPILNRYRYRYLDFSVLKFIYTPFYSKGDTSRTGHS